METVILDLQMYGVGGFLYLGWRGRSINDGKRSLLFHLLHEFTGTLAL